MSDFARTLRTASEAEVIARLLSKVAAESRPYTERERLEALAERYRDYAAALRDTAKESEDEPAAEQVALL